MSEKHLSYLVVLLVLLYALYNALTKKVSSTHRSSKTIEKKTVEKKKHDPFRIELQKLHSDDYTKAYIVHVINHGSEQFDFKGGVMEGGFASVEDAEKIACYVMEFSGRKCEKPYEKNAAMFYSSICAGCHGEDGRGLNGTYPDLTRKNFLGIEKKEAFLRSMLKKTQ